LFHNDKVHMRQWQKGMSIDKTYFWVETFFLIFAAINHENWFGSRNKWKPLLSSNHKEEKQTPWVFRNSMCFGTWHDLWNTLQESGLILFVRDLVLRFNVLWCTTWSMKHALQLVSIILFIKEVTFSHEEHIIVGWQIAMSI